MAGLTLEAFEDQVSSVCAASLSVTSISIVASGVTWVHIRAYLQDGSFVDAFFNEATGKTAFALIKDENRIFGADNTGGWHWHLFESPESHTVAPDEIRFEEFLARIEERLGNR